MLTPRKCGSGVEEVRIFNEPLYTDRATMRLSSHSFLIAPIHDYANSQRKQLQAMEGY